ncbi:MAG: cyclic nucleotide-binding domain-containing protein [bacterium]
MIFLNDLAPHIAHCFTKLSQRGSFPEQGEIIYIKSGHKWPAQKNAYLKKGLLAGFYNKHRLIVIEEGDLIPSLPTDASCYWQAEGASELIATDQTPHTQQQWNALVFALLAQALENTPPTPEFTHINQGELIITQGDDSQRVFSLIEGEVQVIKDEQPVGSIQAGELFGTFAVLTGEKRSASVKALTDCSVLSFSAEAFESLIRSKPDASLQLMRDMAMQIKSMSS